MDNYRSACGEINPRLEKEIEERNKRIQELLKRAAGVQEENFDITVQTKDRSNCTPGPIVNTEQLVVPSTPTETKPFENDQAVTLEIHGDRLIEKGDHQRYEDPNRYHQVPVTLSSIKLRKPQNITLELRSAGPLIGKQNALLTHSIGMQQSRQYSPTTTTATKYEEEFSHNGREDINNNEVMLVINQSGDSIKAEDVSLLNPDEDLMNLRNKYLPTTSL